MTHEHVILGHQAAHEHLRRVGGKVLPEHATDPDYWQKDAIEACRKNPGDNDLSRYLFMAAFQATAATIVKISRDML